MPQIDEFRIGTFCWAELSTNDQQAAKAFYSKIFGWTPDDLPIGPDQFYTMFQLEQRVVGATCTLSQDQREHGVPPHWMLYVAVEDADATTAKAESLGARTLAEPFDVFDAGRMAVIQDPTGAIFSIWQAKSSIGIRLTGVPGTFCWADLATPDQAAAEVFYRSLFGWEFPPGEIHTGYLHIVNRGEFIGGIPPVRPSDGAPPHWLLYFLVAKLDLALEQLKQGGGTVVVPATEIEKAGRFAVVQDPQGAFFAFFESPGATA
ncbi:MAG: VOC family protein [Verrucomicrobia bacterium]|nr:VOC family protein [Verrucomicrobiota bacterium]